MIFSYLFSGCEMLCAEVSHLSKDDREGDVNYHSGFCSQKAELQYKGDFSNLDRTPFFGGGKQSFLLNQLCHSLWAMCKQYEFPVTDDSNFHSAWHRVQY